MPFFQDFFGPSTGNDFFEDWFDLDGEEAAPPSANGGGSKARILGTLAPRPQVPPWRHIDGAAGTMLTEVRRYLNELNDRATTFGNHVEVSFANDTDAVRVDTGLGGPAQGYKIVSANCDIRVYSSRPPSGTDPTPERGIVWLKAAYDADTVPDGELATCTLYIY